jgi:hypothetical protein
VRAGEGVAVTIDGRVVSGPGGALPVNPGDHRLEASAPGKQTHHRDFRVAAGQKLELAVPRLESESAAPEAPSGAPPPAPLDDVGPQPNALPWVLVGSGGALVVGGLVTGLLGKAKYDQLQSGCPQRTCDADDSSLTDAHDAGARLTLVADVLWPLGLVTASVGVSLMFLDDDAATTGNVALQTRLEAGCRPGTCGFSMSGAF